MKNAKKITALLLAAVMILICAACGSAQTDDGNAGLYVGTAMQEDASSAPEDASSAPAEASAAPADVSTAPESGASAPENDSSAIMQGVYDNLVNGEEYAQL